MTRLFRKLCTFIRWTLNQMLFCIVIYAYIDKNLWTPLNADSVTSDSNTNVHRKRQALCLCQKKTIESDYSEKLYFLWDTVRITFQIQSFLLHFFHYPTVILWSVSSLQHLHHYRRHHCINKVKQRYLPVQQKKAYYTSIPHHVLIRPND